MTTDVLHPFVKWVGGKRQLLDQLRARMPPEYNDYYEPFVGGGALLLSEKPRNAHINDINPQLINVYTQLKNDPETVIAAVKQYDDHECSKEYYSQIRESFNRKLSSGCFDADSAAMFIWINKHCFNGLYRENKSGLFNVPFNNRCHGESVDPDNLRRISDYFQTNDISITSTDFETACSTAKADDFVYFDSPYVPVSKTADFTNYSRHGFGTDDHKRLARLFHDLSDRGVYVMLSNNDTVFVRELYHDYNINTVTVNRNINCDKNKRLAAGKEVIITNY